MFYLLSLTKKYIPFILKIKLFLMEIISIIIGVIFLAMFIFLMDSIGTIKRSLQSIDRLLNAWENEKRSVERYTCKVCHNIYTGRVPKCPYCGDEKVYK